MNRNEVIRELASRTGLAPADVRKVIEALFGTSNQPGLIIQTLCHGSRVSFRGFGTFQVRHKAARTLRHPRTGRMLKVPERRVPTFHPSIRFKQVVNRGSSPNGAPAGSFQP